jgi:hypothetical protein
MHKANDSEPVTTLKYRRSKKNVVTKKGGEGKILHYITGIQAAAVLGAWLAIRSSRRPVSTD